MVPFRLIEELRCPFTQSRLTVTDKVSATQDGIVDGVLLSDGYRFPIVNGILVLLPGCDNVVGALERGDAPGALRHALYDLVPRNARTRRRRVADFIEQLPPPISSLSAATLARGAARTVTSDTLSFHAAARQLRHRHYADYLIHRFANPSLLAAIASMSALAHLTSGSDRSNVRPRVLDLACGVGLTSYLIKRFFPTLEVIASDHDFVNLYLARRYVAPGLVLICSDCEALLPYPDDSLAAVFCLDAFHYFEEKAGVVRELERILGTDGLWIFPHLHNRRKENPVAGTPLDPDGYLRIFRNANSRLFGQQAVVEDMVEHQILDLSSSSQDPSDDPALVLVASRDARVWKTYPDPLRNLDYRNLVSNPVYSVREDGDHLTLSVRWPNRQLEAECRDIGRILPDNVRIDAGLVKRLRADQLTESDRSELRALVRHFVFVPMPRGVQHRPSSRSREPRPGVFPRASVTVMT